ncbi:MAG: alpha/beta hydrolase [Bdellovibrionia bacterium]
MKEWKMLESNTRKFIQGLEALGGPPIYQLTYEQAREVLNRAQAEAKVRKLPVDARDEVLPVGPSGKVSVRIVRPEGQPDERPDRRKDALPVVLYTHGGGWVLGNQETHDRLIREIAVGSESVVVFVNYTPAPEARFPTQIEEAYAVMRYISEQSTKLAIDPSRLAVVGESAGGNMAATLAMMAKERGGPRILFQCLLYPVTDSDFDTPSYREFADGPWLTREAMKWFWNAYLPDETARQNPLASPMRASSELLRDLPKTLLITDENDVLRDEGEAYAHKLMNADVEVTALRMAGTIHDFMLLNAIADTPAVRAAIEFTCQMLKDVFAREDAVGAHAA